MLTPDAAVLVIVDLQERLLPVIHEHEALVANLQRLVRGAQVLDLPILLTEQLPDKLGPTVDALRRLLPDHPAIPKSCFSCGGSADFRAQLQELGRPVVLLAGVETHVCVYQTARDLLAADYEVQIVADAVGSRSLRNRDIALQRLRDEGAVWTSVEMCLMEMLGEAGTDTFRAMLPIIR